MVPGRRPTPASSAPAKDPTPVTQRLVEGQPKTDAGFMLLQALELATSEAEGGGRRRRRRWLGRLSIGG